MDSKWLVVLTLVVVMMGSLCVQACNEAVCASLVSKCMLLKSCECNMMDKKNCTCCKDCHKCLAKLYTECCSCVGMCPKSNPKDNLYKTSTVQQLDEPFSGLFDVLTEEEDTLLRWTTYTYPAHLDLLYFKPRGHELNLDLSGNEEGRTIRHGRHHITIDPNSKAQNCTVAYMSQCMSVNKCKSSCTSMGAASFRWFHEMGCCECIGSTCLDFGKGEPLCLKCPEDEEEEEDNEAGRDYEYYEEDEETDLEVDEVKLGEEVEAANVVMSQKEAISDLEGEDKFLGKHKDKMLNAVDSGETVSKVSADEDLNEETENDNGN